jgi:hypothetical protein
VKSLSRTLLSVVLLAGAAVLAGGAYAEAHRVPDQP